MVQLVPMHISDGFYLQAEKLMETAFPSDERRPLQAQRELIGSDAAFMPRFIVDDGAFVGFLNYWEFDTFAYVEHFATEPALRGGGYGGRVLDLLRDELACPIVLEVEYPETDFARRRIAFYERHGYRVWQGHDYVQPPYGEGKEWLPLLLMVNGTLDDGAESFERVRRTLYKRVYGVSSESVR